MSVLDPIAQALLDAMPRCTFTRTCKAPATRGRPGVRSIKYCDFHWACVVKMYDKGIGVTEEQGPTPPDLPGADAVRAAMAKKETSP